MSFNQFFYYNCVTVCCCCLIRHDGLVLLTRWVDIGPMQRFNGVYGHCPLGKVDVTPERPTILSYTYFFWWIFIYPKKLLRASKI